MTRVGHKAAVDLEAIPLSYKCQERDKGVKRVTRVCLSTVFYTFESLPPLLLPKTHVNTDARTAGQA